jgi:hypothetical protein
MKKVITIIISSLIAGSTYGQFYNAPVSYHEIRHYYVPKEKGAARKILEQRVEKAVNDLEELAAENP